jgi:hypothetical protein
MGSTSIAFPHPGTAANGWLPESSGESAHVLTPYGLAGLLTQLRDMGGGCWTTLGTSVGLVPPD